MPLTGAAGDCGSKPPPVLFVSAFSPRIEARTTTHAMTDEILVSARMTQYAQAESGNASFRFCAAISEIRISP
jgi:hypothetical protein